MLAAVDPRIFQAAKNRNELIDSTASVPEVYRGINRAWQGDAAQSTYDKRALCDAARRAVRQGKDQSIDELFNSYRVDFIFVCGENGVDPPDEPTQARDLLNAVSPIFAPLIAECANNESRARHMPEGTAAQRAAKAAALLLAWPQTVEEAYQRLTEWQMPIKDDRGRTRNVTFATYQQNKAEFTNASRVAYFTDGERDDWTGKVDNRERGDRRERGRGRDNGRGGRRGNGREAGRGGSDGRDRGGRSGGRESGRGGGRFGGRGGRDVGRGGKAGGADSGHAKKGPPTPCNLCDQSYNPAEKNDPTKWHYRNQCPRLGEIIKLAARAERRGVNYATTQQDEGGYDDDDYYDDEGDDDFEGAVASISLGMIDDSRGPRNYATLSIAMPPREEHAPVPKTAIERHAEKVNFLGHSAATRLYGDLCCNSATYGYDSRIVRNLRPGDPNHQVNTAGGKYSANLIGDSLFEGPVIVNPDMKVNIACMDRLMRWYPTKTVLDPDAEGDVVRAYVMRLDHLNYDLVFMVEDEVVVADLTELLSLNPQFYTPPPLPDRPRITTAEIERAIGRKLRMGEDFELPSEPSSNFATAKAEGEDEEADHTFEPSYKKQFQQRVTEEQLKSGTVKGRAAFELSKRVLEKSLRASDFCKLAGYMHPEKMEKLMTNGEFLVPPNRLSSGDFRRAARYVNPDISHYKGTMTMKRKPGKELEEELGPRQLAAQFDIVFWGPLSFFLSVVRPSYHTWGSYLGEGQGARSTKSVQKALKGMFDHYSALQYQIVTATADPERGFSANQAYMASRGCSFKPGNKGDGVPDIDNRAKETKKIARTQIFDMGGTISIALLKMLFIFCVCMVNLHACAANVNSHSPDFVLSGGKQKDPNLIFRARFGQVVAANTENRLQRNSVEKPRAAICLAIQPFDTKGTWQLYNLETGGVIYRTDFKPIADPPNLDELKAKLSSEDQHGLLNDLAIFGADKEDRLPEPDSAEQAEPLADFFEPTRATDFRPVSEPSPHLRTPAREFRRAEEFDEAVYSNAPNSLPPTTTDVVREGVGVLPNDHDLPRATGTGRTPRIWTGPPRLFSPARAERVDVAREGVGVLPEEDPPRATGEGPPPKVFSPAEAIRRDAYSPGSAEPINISRFIQDVSEETATSTYTRPARSRQPPDKYRDGEFVVYGTIKEEVTFATQMSLRKALDTYGPEARLAIIKEIEGILERRVWHGVLRSSLSQTQRKKIIYSSFFIKPKYLDGFYAFLKGRIVAGGNLQDRGLYEQSQISSPTASTAALLSVIAQAAAKGHKVMSFDIGQAYLNADMNADVFVYVAKEVAEVVCELDPSYVKFLEPDGKLLVKLDKALYGCIESAKLWYLHFKGSLEELGYVANPMDNCVFNRKNKDGTYTTVVIYVDDALVTSPKQSALDELAAAMKKRYGVVEVRMGPIHQYLGMKLDFSKPGLCHVTMEKYIVDLIEE